MYFKKLEIIGFKSFFNKTVLQFEPGITAIVGPNGCGKSNIFDAIRWVLGEQSVKSMRGSSMEDVIFNGSDSKEPLSMAEVNLTFDNSSRFFSVGHSEVIITRRIFRSGESEYFLNKAEVRLKDISELLMGTGIGAESYSLVPQGKIDLILSSKPEDRRLIFDEASGITKYKTQKKEAIRRLDETEQNLLRINDIILEVKRQISSLERQANKARKFKEVFEELKSKELVFATLQKKEIETQKTKIDETIGDFTAKVTLLIDAIKEQEFSLANCQNESKKKEEEIFKIKGEINELNNSFSRYSERITADRERILELDSDQKYRAGELGQVKTRLTGDEERLNAFKTEYQSIEAVINEKTALLKETETHLENISQEIKKAAENTVSAKNNIFNLAAGISTNRSELSEFLSKKQIHSARKKRLEIEKTKITEEKALVEINLNNINHEIYNLKEEFKALLSKITAAENNLDNQKISLNNTNAQIEQLEKQSLSLYSQKQFLEQLITRYNDIGESMDALIYLDKLPQEKISGLVIKVKDVEHTKVLGEAKPFDLDTHNINEKIVELAVSIETLKNTRAQISAEAEISEKILIEHKQTLHSSEIALTNKEAAQRTISEAFNKINEESGIIAFELQDVNTELNVFETKISEIQINLKRLEIEQKTNEDLITNEQDKVAENSRLKEGSLLSIVKIKTELDALNRRIDSDKDTLKMLESRYEEDKQNLIGIEKQIEENNLKYRSLELEIKELEEKTAQANLDITGRGQALQEAENNFNNTLDILNHLTQKGEADKQARDELKNRLYELQMQRKELEFKYLSLKERLLNSYKVNLDGADIASCAGSSPLPNETEVSEIEKLKERLNAYGTVNLVAIEEYDELKKRYDFLTGQQTDLVTATKSISDAISKINRTTKRMFLETFEKVQIEFRNYFKLLFNGGDAQIYLIDEQDPLESGIELICRPPGKKLQNVLLLSGGEKAMSAIALIFAIFKIKPAPFCVLDEIDAALDEANVDRFGKALQEFAQNSQFIVITHNKKTISCAAIMYGITIEDSGVSKIVSVKFASEKTAQNISERQPRDLEPV